MTSPLGGARSIQLSYRGMRSHAHPSRPGLWTEARLASPGQERRGRSGLLPGVSQLTAGRRGSLAVKAPAPQTHPATRKLTAHSGMIRAKTRARGGYERR